jgi:Fe-S cluster assembly iron-binding protein IscA
VLRLTRNAVAMIEALKHEAQLPDGGLRIAQAREHPGLRMQLATSPRAEDDVLRAGQVRLFLDPIARDRLRDETLDARTTEAGSAFFLGS